MAEGRPSNVAYRQLIVPPCPLKHTPYPVRIELARSIDIVNDSNGFGWMQLAHFLGCSATYIRSIEARATYDRQHSYSPTMVLFSDLQDKNDPLFTIRHIERALLELNLEAVSILHKHLLEIERAYHVSISSSHSLDINNEPSICNCPNCIHQNLNCMPQEPSVRPSHTPRTTQHPSESERIPPVRNSPTQRRYELGPFQHPSESERIQPVGNFPTPRTYEFEQFEHLSLSERTPTSHSTLTPLVIPQHRGGVGMGPFTAPPYMQPQEQRNIYMMNHSRRQMPNSSQSNGIHSESLNTFSGRSYPSHAHDLPYTQNIPGNDENGYTQGQSGYTQGQSGYTQGKNFKRTMEQELKSQDVLISPDDNCQVSDEEGVCTCGISSSELHDSDFPGNNEGHQQTSQHSGCTCCLLSDETFVKPSYDQEAVDYSQCICHSPTNIHNNELGRNGRKYFSDLSLECEKKENHSVDDKRNSLHEKKTDSFCNGKENGNSIHSMKPTRRGPGFSVFVTYSRHSREHVKEVIELCEKLKANGIRVRVDFSGDQAQDLFKNKHDWLDENLKRARFVIVCISPTYSEDIDHPNSDTEPIPDVTRLDVRFIYDHLRTEYHGNCSQNKRVIPVIFENSSASRKHLPNFMHTTIVYSYPRQVISIVEFLQSSSPGKSDLSK